MGSRPASAMRESRSGDFPTQACVALEAAIRDEIYLLELVTSPKPPPIKPMPAVTLA